MTTGIKTLSPLRRRADVSHDDLVRHWRDPHAPGVKAHMRPDRYAITFFDPQDGKAVYDGMAALSFDDRDHARSVTGRNMPRAVATDGFGDLVEQPMTALRVVEHVIVAGPSGDPATPDERAAAYKMTFFVRPGAGQDLANIQRHWLEIHAPNVASTFVAAGGVRYVVNLVDLAAGAQEFVGVAELSYRDRDAFKGHAIADDGFNALTSPSVALRGQEWVVAWP
jgi:hypothetical protein